MAEDLAVVPDPIDDVVAASLPVAYLTAQITLTLAGFKAAHTVLAPAIGGSVGNATYQVARAQGAGTVISTAGSAAKARARELGFEDVIDLTTEGLADGVRRITAGKRVDIVIDSIGGTVTGEALSSLGLDGVLITLGYSAGRKTTIDLTDLIWKRARMAGFSMFAQSPTAIANAWRDDHPVDRRRIGQPDRRASIPTRPGLRSLVPSQRGSAVWQSRFHGVTALHLTRGPVAAPRERGAFLAEPRLLVEDMASDTRDKK